MSDTLTYQLAQPDQQNALIYCAGRLGASLNGEILKSFSTYFQ